MKWIVIGLCLIGAAFGIAPIRARILPHLDPVLGRLGPAGEKISAPAKRLAAKNEANILLRRLAQDHADRKELPDPLSFQTWVRLNTKGGKRGLDPWGHPYYLVRGNHQMTVGSHGPDRKRNTRDDVRASAPIE